jgi:hypothetical protein
MVLIDHLAFAAAVEPHYQQIAAQIADEYFAGLLSFWHPILRNRFPGVVAHRSGM